MYFDKQMSIFINAFSIFQILLEKKHPKNMSHESENKTFLIFSKNYSAIQLIVVTLFVS